VANLLRNVRAVKFPWWKGRHHIELNKIAALFVAPNQFLTRLIPSQPLFQKPSQKWDNN
jgi:hypothetical protein